MSDWKVILKANSIDWLLDEENPSVRYFTLKDILGLSSDDTIVQTAKREIMQTAMVHSILDGQREPAYLQAYPRFYTYKYKGLV